MIAPPDVDLIRYLSSSLKHIAESDFISLFESHKYALAQIEKLTPQSLSILSDHKIWPQFSINAFSANGGKITSDWLEYFVRVYAPMKGIQDQALSSRLLHSLNDLRSYRLIDAWLVQGQEKQGHVVLSDVGQSIISYIDT